MTEAKNMRKKKQRPKKLKAKGKHEKVSLDKTSPSSRSNGQEFESFLDEMIQWFLDHQQQVDEMFSHSDTDRRGSVSAKDFELGLMNLNISCQQFQLHMLTQLLKNANNMVSYQDLSRQIQRLRLSEGTEVVTRISEDVSRLDRHAPHQLFNPKNRFICLSVRLIPFEFSAAHPGNFQVVLLSSSRVFSLIRTIQDQVGIQTLGLEVFRSRVPAEESCLPPESSLEECGFKGGPEETPTEDTVYYDYRLLLTDCPILNCDHYFSAASDSAIMRRSQRP